MKLIHNQLLLVFSGVESIADRRSL